MPKEIADYLNKMGARVPNIKPGKATVDFLTKIQASTRFWGKMLLLHYSVCMLLLFILTVLCQLYCRWCIAKSFGDYISPSRSLFTQYQ